MTIQTVRCPRCEATLDSEYYGPCGSCRDELRAMLGSDKSALSSSEFEPKMNVTPNSVATKD